MEIYCSQPSMMMMIVPLNTVWRYPFFFKQVGGPKQWFSNCTHPGTTFFQKYILCGSSSYVGLWITWKLETANYAKLCFSTGNITFTVLQYSPFSLQPVNLLLNFSQKKKHLSSWLLGHRCTEALVCLPRTVSVVYACYASLERGDPGVDLSPAHTLRSIRRRHFAVNVQELQIFITQFKNWMT